LARGGGGGEGRENFFYYCVAIMFPMVFPKGVPNSTSLGGSPSNELERKDDSIPQFCALAVSPC